MFLLKSVYFICAYIYKFLIRYAIAPFHLASFAEVGKKCRVNRNSLFIKHSHIHLGDNVSIGPNAVFYAYIANIYIGNNVMFGPNVTISAGGHRIDNLDVPMALCTKKTEDDDKDIVIEDDVWIGANVVILKGVHIAKGCVIGAGSVVTKSTTPFGVYVGNPAKIIRYRK